MRSIASGKTVRNVLKHHLSAGDVNGLAGAVGSLRAGVKHQHVKYVLVIAAALQRDFVDVILLDLLLRDPQLGGVLRQ